MSKVCSVNESYSKLLAASYNEEKKEVMFFVPSGKPGKVSRIVQVPTSEAKQFALDLLQILIEEEDPESLN